MPELKNTFQSGKMEKDIDERIVPSSQYREALNIGVATSEDSDVGAAQNILGNLKVTEAIQSRTWTELGNDQGPDVSSFDLGGKEYAGDNYHIAAIVDPKTDMLYRFINTESENEGIWMDRIVEYNTMPGDYLSMPYWVGWWNKESAVMVDIYKVRDSINSTLELCEDSNKTKITIEKNTNQVRWGMAVSIIDGFNVPLINVNNRVIVENVNYSNGIITLNKDLSYLGDLVNMEIEIFFHGDRNLNFHKNRKITAINILDGMLFWTDNYSEPKKVHIERGKMGSDSASHATNSLLVGRGIQKIDDFNQHTLLVVEEVVQEDYRKDDSFCVSLGCTDPSAFNYDSNATVEDGSCVPTKYGCTCGGDDILGTINGLGNYNDCNGDGYASANFDPTANVDDGSCVACVWGCMDVTACNYDASANVTCDDGSCILPDGCTDPAMFNYDPAAVCDDGLCEPYIYGCMDDTACNYNASANTDDGSCLYCDPCALPDDTVSISYTDDGDGNYLISILYNVMQDIAGYQLGIFNGVNSTSLGGGDAATAGFTESSSSSNILGFSLTGTLIPAGCGILTTFVASEPPPSTMTTIILSNATGGTLAVSYAPCSC